MAQINWTFEAQKWLKEIYDYIALDKQLVADRVIDEIIDKVLNDFPETGYKYLP